MWLFLSARTEKDIQSCFFRDWNKKIVNLYQWIFAFLEKKSHGRYLVLPTHPVNLTDQGLLHQTPSGYGAGRDTLIYTHGWLLGSDCLPFPSKGEKVDHHFIIYPWSVYISRMPTKPWIKLRNLKETCKLKLTHSHLLLLFIYLV